jgi:sec-independent protein translocase protein TatA
VPKLVVIAGVAALVFEPKKLPEVGKNIGKIVKSFQQVGGSFWLPFHIQVKDRKF